MATEHQVPQQSLMVRSGGGDITRQVTQQSLMVRINTINEVLPTPTGEGGFVTVHHWATFKEGGA